MQQTYGITLQLFVDRELHTVSMTAWSTDNTPRKRTFELDSTLPARLEVEMDNLVRQCCSLILKEHNTYEHPRDHA